ncbi:MAG: hypothetical protein IPP78_04800 [Holophagaceae bacterium]|nr:hypothetical protein [Holophagaceae bacterium]
MTLDEFTDITMMVLEEQGIASYAPTLVAQGMIQVVQGIPEEMDQRDAIQDVIRRASLGGEEILFAVKSGPGEVTTGSYSPQGSTFQLISRMPQGYTVAALDSCDWWTLDSGTSH